MRRDETILGYPAQADLVLTDPKAGVILPDAGIRQGLRFDGEDNGRLRFSASLEELTMRLDGANPRTCRCCCACPNRA